MFALFGVSVAVARIIGEESIAAFPIWIAAAVFCAAFLWYGLADLHEYLDNHTPLPPRGGKDHPEQGGLLSCVGERCIDSATV